MLPKELNSELRTTGSNDTFYKTVGSKRIVD